MESASNRIWIAAALVLNLAVILALMGLDAALDLLRFTEDFAVMEAAADLLSGVPRVPALATSDLGILTQVYAEVEDRRIRDALGRMLLDQAVQRGDADLGRGLVDDLERIGAATCPESDPAPTCARRREDLAGAEGQLAARGGPEPQRWRAALAAAAWRCHLEGHALEAPLTVEARWSGGWTWAAWSLKGPMARCLENQAAGAVGPDAPALVALEIRGPGPDSEGPRQWRR